MGEYLSVPYHELCYRANGESISMPQRSVTFINTDAINEERENQSLLKRYPKALFWVESRSHVIGGPGYVLNWVKFLHKSKDRIVLTNPDQLSFNKHLISEIAWRYDKILNRGGVVVDATSANSYIENYMMYALTWADGHANACKRVTRACHSFLRVFDELPIKTQWQQYLFIRRVMDPYKQDLEKLVGFFAAQLDIELP